MIDLHEKSVICKELMFSGVKSIILIGSRASGIAAKNTSDYDIYVVTPAWAVPFIYAKIKQKEIALEKKLGATVSAFPLTMWRLKRKKDLLLFKTKKEGKTLCGINYLPLINIDDISEISSDELFSYLFSSVFYIVEYFDPSKDQSEVKEKIIYKIAKSITYCAELQLFLNGIYEKDRKNILIRVRNDIGINSEICDIFNLTENVMKGDVSQINDLNAFWFAAKGYLLLVFRQLVERFLDTKNEAIIDSIELYKTSERSFIKNVQYSVLYWMKERKNPMFSVLTDKSIEKYLNCSLFYLMLSIEENLTINENYLNNVYQTLDSINQSPKTSNDCNNVDLWREAKKKIMEFWPMASGKEIV